MSDKEIRALLEKSLTLQDGVVSGWLKKHALVVALAILAASLFIQRMGP